MTATDQQSNDIPADLYPEILSSLPEELLSEILSRLPVKSLLRFRSVSKAWLALIDDTDFARLHYNNFNNNSNQTRLFVTHEGVDESGGVIHQDLVLCSDTLKLIQEVSSTDDLFESPYIISCVHGLLLVRDHVRPIDGQFYDLKVWNPSIRKVLEIPLLLNLHIEVSDRARLLRDQTLGIGYDTVAKNYKCVKLIYISNNVHSVAIYALGADSWKIINFEGEGSSWQWNVNGYEESVYFRSSLYFIARDKLNYKASHLVWFDLSKEVFSSISMPDGYVWQLMSINGGSLVAFGRNPQNHVRWALDSESMCWTNQGSFLLKGFPLHIKKNGDLLMHISVQCNNMVGLYSSETEKHKAIMLDFTIEPFTLSCYVESLFLHKIN